jgi:hypothetical protein
MGLDRLRRVCKLIDEGLMALDQALCERARIEGIPRQEIAVVDCDLQRLRAMLSAFSQDGHLWSQFQREVRGPRDVIFDYVYAKSLALGRAKSKPHREALDEALSLCDAEGWAKRINALADGDSLDGLTVHAVAYVLGGNTEARRQFIAGVEGRLQPSG